MRSPQYTPAPDPLPPPTLPLLAPVITPQEEGVQDPLGQLEDDEEEAGEEAEGKGGEEFPESEEAFSHLDEEWDGSDHPEDVPEEDGEEEEDGFMDSRFLEGLPQLQLLTPGKACSCGAARRNLTPSENPNPRSDAVEPDLNLHPTDSNALGWVFFVHAFVLLHSLLILVAVCLTEYWVESPWFCPLRIFRGGFRSLDLHSVSSPTLWTPRCILSRHLSLLSSRMTSLRISLEPFATPVSSPCLSQCLQLRSQTSQRPNSEPQKTASLRKFSPQPRGMTLWTLPKLLGPRRSSPASRPQRTILSNNLLLQLKQDNLESRTAASAPVAEILLVQARPAHSPLEGASRGNVRTTDTLCRP